MTEEEYDLFCFIPHRSSLLSVDKAFGLLTDARKDA